MESLDQCYAPRWLFTISYPTRAHGIIVNYNELLKFHAAWHVSWQTIEDIRALLCRLILWQGQEIWENIRMNPASGQNKIWDQTSWAKEDITWIFSFLPGSTKAKPTHCSLLTDQAYSSSWRFTHTLTIDTSKIRTCLTSSVKANGSWLSSPPRRRVTLAISRKYALIICKNYYNKDNL